MKRKEGDGQLPTQDKPRGGSRRKHTKTTVDSRSPTASGVIDEKQNRAPRQDPVSCQTCRSRKLKCDRQNPCSNCVSRRVDCVYLARANAATAASTKFSYNTTSSNALEAASPIAGSQSLSTSQPHGLSLVERQPPTQTQARPDRVQPETNVPSLSTSDQFQLDESNSTLDRLEKIVMAPRPSGTLPRASRDNFTSSFPPRDFMGPYSHGMGAVSYGNHDWPHAAALTSCLPRESEAIAMFEYYINNIDYIYHIIIHSRVRQMIDDIYADLHKHAHVNLNHLALLFSILAVTSYFQPSTTREEPNSDTRNQEEERAREYTSMVGAALIQADYLAYPTLESLQATVLIAHLMPTISTSASIRAFFLHATIVSQAKQLMLHCIDSPRYQESPACDSDLVALEVRRRVWWNIVGYDWLLSFLGGPQEHTYLIHPNHMCVNLPIHVEDDQLLASSEQPQSLPMSVPTSMSFAIARLQLANLARELTDEIATAHFQGSELSYDMILAIDKKLHQLGKEIPPFFRVDPVARKQYAQLYRQRPNIAWQRLLAQQGYHTRLVRLHRHFFLKGVKDPKYSYSHMVCVQSARRVLEIKRIMDEEEPIFSPPSSTVWSVMHHSFLSAVILMMDVCFNWDDILADQKRNEVLEACRRLTKAQWSTSVVRDGINEMMKILQKYWSSEARPSSSLDGRSDAAQVQVTSAPAPVSAPGNLPVYHADGSSSSFNQAYDSQQGPKNVFANLNSQPQLSITDRADNWELEDIWAEFLNNGATLNVDPEDWTGMLAELSGIRTGTY